MFALLKSLHLQSMLRVAFVSVKRTENVLNLSYVRKTGNILVMSNHAQKKASIEHGHLLFM